MGDAAPRGLDALRIDRTAAPRRSCLRRWLWVAGVGAVLVLALLALKLGGTPQVHVAEIRQARPGEQQTELIAAGYVTSRRRSVIAPQIAGRLVEVLVDEGDAVKEGQVLARLDDRDARVAATRAEAELGAARQRYAAARATAARARNDRLRAERLGQEEVITRADLDAARATAHASAAEAWAAQSQLTSAQRALEAARLQWAHTVVRAPFAGTVVRKLADAGAVLAPAALEQQNIGGIVELVDLEALEVQAEVSEEQLPRIQRGQPALVFLDAYPDQAWRAEVRSVRPTIDRSKATASVNVRFEKIPPGVLPDMGARVAFLKEALAPEELAHDTAALRAPASSVVQGPNGQPVVWAVKDGRLEPQPVHVDHPVGNEVALDKGPPPGTQVVVVPRGKLRAGRRVKVQLGGG